MSNETTPQLVECRIKSFETNGNEWTTVTLQIPEHITDAVVKASTSREPMLRVLVEAVPAVPAHGADDKGLSEEIAEKLVVRGAGNGIALLLRSGFYVASFRENDVHAPVGEKLAFVRAWLAGLVREGYEAGVASVAQTKADGAACLVETYGPDALAKAREEGRRQGWEEAAAFFDATAKQHTGNRDSKQREAHSLRAQAARLDEEARVQQETAKMARAVAAELRAAAPKEPA